MIRDPRAAHDRIRRRDRRRFLTRENGGYATSMGLSGPGATIREIDIIISPAASTLLAAVEQTFTVPGVLAADRAIAVTPTSNPAFGTSVGTYGAPRVTAISIVA